MTSADHDQAALTERAKSGDKEALVLLANLCRPGLVRLAVLLINDADEAESLAQEAIARAMARLTDFHPQANFSAWVRGITLNLCREHLRRVNRQARTGQSEQLEQVPQKTGRKNGVLSEIFKKELSDRVRLLLAQLPETYREAVVLHYIEGLDYDRISEITGISPGTLRVRALRGRALLKVDLGTVVDTWMRNSPENEKKL